MPKIICYRIDHRDLVAGDIITSPGDHLKILSESLQVAEQILREFSDEKEKLRSDSLYVFGNLIRASKYFIGKKGFLYELEMDESDVLHIANMLLVNDLSEVEDGVDAIAIVQRYWDGERSKGDYDELLVTKAVVTKLLYSQADKQMLIKKYYR